MVADVLVFHDIIRGDPESRKLEGGRREVDGIKSFAGILQQRCKMYHQCQFPVSMGLVIFR